MSTATLSAALGTRRRTAGDGAMSRYDGAATVQLGADGALLDLYQRAPCRAFLPRIDAGSPPEVVFANVAGGVAGGDRLRYRLEAGQDGCATGTTQAAEKVYRALDTDSHIHTHLVAGPGSRLEWLPQETIVFDGARLRRRTEVEVAGDARFLGLEWLVLGRRAHGETLTRGSLLDSWRVRVDGHLRWADGLRLDGDIASLVERRASLDGARALATLLYVADDAEQRIDLARECLPVDLRCGATLVNGMLLARFLADEPLALRQAVSMFLQGFRSGLAGGAVALPRVWAC